LLLLLVSCCEAFIRGWFSIQPSQTYGRVSQQQPNVARLLAIVPESEGETNYLLPDDPHVRSVVDHPIFHHLAAPAASTRGSRSGVDTMEYLAALSSKYLARGSGAGLSGYLETLESSAAGSSGSSWTGASSFRFGSVGAPAVDTLDGDVVTGYLADLPSNALAGGSGAGLSGYLETLESSAAPAAPTARGQHAGFESRIYLANELPDEEGHDNAIYFPVWFCTNRKIDYKHLEFSSMRSNTMALGKAQVRILKYHETPGQPPPSFFEKIRRFDFRNDFEVVRTTSLRAENFKEDLSASKGQDSLLFIHGYNVDFQNAAIRAAQLGFDLKVPGITAFFSWPAQGKTASYMVDEATIAASERYIADFLVNFSRQIGSGKVHIIAHSMGNRGLLRALQRIQQMPDTRDVSFGQVIFAAPDEDRDVFRDTVEEFVRPASETQLAKRFTLYASKHDKAVWTSALLHQAPRAGFWLPYTEANGLDSIATKVNSDFLGHSYFAEARPVLLDIKLLVANNEGPSKRGFELEPVKNHRNLWRLK
jgi:esterase/lipase superfamily enzyme